MLTEEFAELIGAELIRDDDVFNAAVVSFGTFGIIAAVAVETAPIYQLAFPAIVDVQPRGPRDAASRVREPRSCRGLPLRVHLRPTEPQAYGDGGKRAEGAVRAGHPTPKPRWIIRDKLGYAPGDNVLNLAWLLRLLPPRLVTKIEFGEYRKYALLNQVRGTPGQLYTSSIYYLEGYTESAFGVAIADAPATIDIVSQVARDIRLPSISQVRLVRASEATLGFTQHEPRTAVFEVGQINDDKFPKFERSLDEAFRAAGIRYTMHWSKNSGIDPAKLEYMYGADRIASWKAARSAVFGGDDALMRTFASDAMVQAGLA